MDTIENNRQVAQKWIGAFNRHDLEQLLSLYADDAVHFSPRLKQKQPATNGFISGKPALRHWWEEAFTRLPSLQYDLKNLVADEQQVLMEYLRRVTGDPDMMIAEILEIENGLIIRSRLYMS